MKTTMKQIQFHMFGGPEVLVEQDVATPQPGAGEVLVRVTATGVNFSDVLRRRNTYFMPTPLPFILGTEVVGVVEKIGPEVNSLFKTDLINSRA